MSGTAQKRKVKKVMHEGLMHERPAGLNVVHKTGTWGNLLILSRASRECDVGI